MAVLWISPWRLFKTDYFAASIFAVAAVAFVLQLLVIVLRGVLASVVGVWSGTDGIVGLDGLNFSLIAAALFHATLLFLLIDVILSLLLPSRDLQEGGVMAFGIVSIMQIPIVTCFLHNVVAYSDDCASWWASLRLAGIGLAAASCALHLFLLILCVTYVRKRPATSQDLLADVGKARALRRKKSKKAKKSKKPRPEYTFYSSSDSDAGRPEPKPPLYDGPPDSDLEPSVPLKKPKASALPPLPAPPLLPPPVIPPRLTSTHTDSD
ncbi:hypothetical protein JCM10207_004612 [Rhodosporidiobolus poonsookiae]